MATEVDDRCVCPLCLEVFKSPVYVNTCTHTFCASCLQQVPPDTDGSMKCPICRTPFLSQDVKQHRPLQREITTTCITCSICGLSCLLRDWNQHCTLHPLPRPSAPLQTRTPACANRSTFSCPLCPQVNLSCSDLVTHVNTHHAHSKDKVVCPICASMPWGVTHQVSQNFVQHLNLRHKFEYETYVDYEQDEEATLQAVLKASLTEQ